MLVEKPITEERVFVVPTPPFNEELLYEASGQCVEWLAIEEANRAKESNFMQESIFTPVYWKVMEYDEQEHPSAPIPHSALIVLGRILGYCQMANGSCSASLTTIAKQVHMELNTIKRAVKILENRGYIDDTTPNRVKAPHVYVPTEKLKRILKKSGIKNDTD